MAAFETPLVTQLIVRAQHQQQHPPDHLVSSTAPPSPPMPQSKTEAKATVNAQFPPNEQPPATTSPKIAHSHVNFLDSTPPQIVRALGQAEPLVRGLNVVLGLLTWTSGQDWLSFFVLVGWWVLCLYGEYIIKFAGNFIPAVCIVLWYAAHRASHTEAERTSTHSSLANTLNEIDTLRTRISLFLTPPSLLIPYLSLPASQPLLLRLCYAWPIWLFITHKVLQPKKIVMIVGTAVLCWSAPWARIICIALWRSRTIRKVCGLIIGEDILTNGMEPSNYAETERTAPMDAEQRARREANRASHIQDVLEGGIKITQTLYQSQRRWIGIGWTANLFPNERSPWADETERPCSSIDEYTLPADKSMPHTLPNGQPALRVAKWRWIDPEWKPVVKLKETDAEGWIYTDNTWKNPGPQEAFGKYTRRRKFLRTAELKEDILPVAESSQGSTRPSLSPEQASNRRVSRTETAKSETSSVRNTSPEAVRPGGTAPSRTSLESDLRDAVGLGINGSESSASTREMESFGSNS